LGTLFILSLNPLVCSEAPAANTGFTKGASTTVGTESYACTPAANP